MSGNKANAAKVSLARITIDAPPSKVRGPILMHSYFSGHEGCLEESQLMSSNSSLRTIVLSRRITTHGNSTPRCIKSLQRWVLGTTGTRLPGCCALLAWTSLHQEISSPTQRHSCLGTYSQRWRSPLKARWGLRTFTTNTFLSFLNYYR